MAQRRRTRRIRSVPDSSYSDLLASVLPATMPPGALPVPQTIEVEAVDVGKTMAPRSLPA